MKQTIIFKDLFNTELYTRSKATELKDIIRADADEVEFNFSDVTFMSRSFADELYNIQIRSRISLSSTRTKMM